CVSTYSDLLVLGISRPQIVASVTVQFSGGSSVEPVLTGQSESLEFVLVDDVFLIDRNFSIFFVALFLYLPFFII
ncbi:hypothetical protein, partial [Roseicyclus mahoneyensis]